MNYNPCTFLWKRFLPPLPIGASLIASARAQSFSIQLSRCGGNLLCVKGMEVRRGWEPDEVQHHGSDCAAGEQTPFLPQIPFPAVARKTGVQEERDSSFEQFISQGLFTARDVSSLC